MGTFLFLLFVFFIVIPIIRVMATIWRARRQTRRFFDQFRTAAGAGASTQTRQKEAPRQPKTKKKIDPSVGEYVAFEEIKTETTTADARDAKTYTEVEQQIVDVEWEDIK
ncbi:MAG: hypothetical protein ACI4AX_07570 [Muribaculaceae bacterium]